MHNVKNRAVIALRKAADFGRKTASKAPADGTALTLAGWSAMGPGGGTSPGAAIAGGLDNGPTEMGLVFVAVAVLIGLLLVWTYIKRSAK